MKHSSRRSARVTTVWQPNGFSERRSSTRKSLCDETSGHLPRQIGVPTSALPRCGTDTQKHRLQALSEAVLLHGLQGKHSQSSFTNPAEEAVC